MTNANNHLREAKTLVNLQTQKYKNLEQQLRETDARAIEETIKKMKENQQTDSNDKTLDDNEDDSWQEDIASTRKLIIYINALFESYNDPRTSKLGTDFIGTILNWNVKKYFGYLPYLGGLP